MKVTPKIMAAAGVGLILSNIIPTPGDALYFYQKKRNIEKLNNKEISPTEFWTKDAVGYYFYNATWWALVLGGSMMLATDLKQPKFKMFVALTGLAAVGTVMYNNIKNNKDEKTTTI